MKEVALTSPLHTLVEEQVERTPDAPAVVFGGERLTYRELDARANRLARLLRREGVGPETLVAICAERSLEMVVGLFAILKAGGAYVPLDPSYPKERLAFMLEDAGAPVLLIQERLLGLAADTRARVVFLDANPEGIEDSPERFEGGVVSENLAYVIYTSGSTGRPKGAMNTHQGIVNRLLWMQDTYGLTGSDSVLQKTPFSFDVSVWEFFWPLLAGARLVLARPGGHQDGAYLVNLIAEEKITVLHFVPSMLAVFLEEADLSRCASLRQVICSGEALAPEHVERFFARLPARLDNLYGPTEAAVDVTVFSCEREPARRIVPIGRAVANTRIHILDRGLRPAAAGAEGELSIGGIQVGRGYWNRPDLTAERFRPDPFSGEPGARLYATGDIARLLPDGNIEFLGRLDDQVKIRGHRIELAEIESALRGHEGVAAAAVAAREDVPGSRRLVAYLVPSQHSLPPVSELRDFLSEKLPEYMVPALFVPLAALPLSPSGKLDRRALPAPGSRRPDLTTPYEPPRTELERFLAGLWGEVLGLDKVGVKDRFFELGGDSIQGAILINRLQREIGEHIYIVALFTAPSVAEFARFLEASYSEAVARKWGGKPATSRAAPAEKSIGESEIAEMRRLVPTRSPSRDEDRPEGSRNSRALFILAPPRSGTTLLRVMLAGHPDLFAGAELQLLGFNTLEERRNAFTGKFRLWLEGTVRALMEIENCDAEAAKKIMEEYEANGLTTKAFYRVLQDRIGGRTLVDKSPAYAMDPAALAKAERDFEDPLYIHLARHPYSMVRSFEGYHMDQVLFLPDHRFSPRELGELVWTISHQNVLDFLSRVPPARQYRMRYEDLASRPVEVMRGMCEQLGLSFHEDLLTPYKDKERKMTDGIYAASTPMGDTKFLSHGEINPKAAEGWKKVAADNFLGDATWEVARALGYDAPAPPEEAGAREERESAATRRGRLARQKELRQRSRGEAAAGGGSGDA